LWFGITIKIGIKDVIQQGSPIDNILRRIASLIHQSQAAINADIDVIRDRADDPRPALRLIANELRNLAQEAVYLAGRAEELAEEYTEPHRG
jgi:hypothetical protein